jgi:hypothetical protein
MLALKEAIPEVIHITAGKTFTDRSQGFEWGNDAQFYIVIFSYLAFFFFFFLFTNIINKVGFLSLRKKR